MIYDYLFEMSIAILQFLIYGVSNLLFRFFSLFYTPIFIFLPFDPKTQTWYNEA